MTQQGFVMMEPKDAEMLMQKQMREAQLQAKEAAAVRVSSFNFCVRVLSNLYTPDKFTSNFTTTRYGQAAGLSMGGPNMPNVKKMVKSVRKK